MSENSLKYMGLKWMVLVSFGSELYIAFVMFIKTI